MVCVHSVLCTQEEIVMEKYVLSLLVCLGFTIEHQGNNWFKKWEAERGDMRVSRAPLGGSVTYKYKGVHMCWMKGKRSIKRIDITPGDLVYVDADGHEYTLDDDDLRF